MRSTYTRITPESKIMKYRLFVCRLLARKNQTSASASVAAFHLEKLALRHQRQWILLLSKQSN